MQILAQIAVSAERSLFGDAKPLEVARTLVAAGARALQLRDVDGSLARMPGGGWLGEFAAVGVPVQFDAALCDPALIERVSRLGFASVVVGMDALFDPLLLRWAMDVLGERLLVELRVDGDYLFDTPRSEFALELDEAIRRLRLQGVRHVLYRDVTGLVVPRERLHRVCETLGMPTTFAGLVRSVDDVSELASLDGERLVGIVIGEPLFDGRIGVVDAQRIAGEGNTRR